MVNWGLVLVVDVCVVGKIDLLFNDVLLSIEVDFDIFIV